MVTKPLSNCMQLSQHFMPSECFKCTGRNLWIVTDVIKKFLQFKKKSPFTSLLEAHDLSYLSIVIYGFMQFNFKILCPFGIYSPSPSKRFVLHSPLLTREGKEDTMWNKIKVVTTSTLNILGPHLFSQISILNLFQWGGIRKVVAENWIISFILISNILFLSRLGC